jgi:hypothetical protein
MALSAVFIATQLVPQASDSPTMSAMPNARDGRGWAGDLWSIVARARRPSACVARMAG